MSDIIPVGSRNATAKGFLDMSRPIPMIASDRLFKTVSTKFGSGVQDILEISGKLRTVVESSNPGL